MSASPEFVRLLNHTFTLWRHQRIFDGAGGWKQQPMQVTSFKGRLSGGRAQERLVGGKWQAHVGLTLFAEAGLDVKRHDMIEGYGKHLRVVDVREPSLLGHHLEIEVEETKTGA